MQKIIDTHVHLFDLKEFEYPWLELYPKLKKSFLLEDYLNDISTLNVDALVLIEADVKKEQRRLEIEYLTTVAKNSNKEIGLIVAVDLLDHDVEIFLRGISTNPYIKGVRHILHLDDQSPTLCLDRVFIENLKKIEKYGLIFEACVKMKNLNYFYELALRAPKVVMVLNHMGNVDPSLFDRQGVPLLKGKLSQGNKWLDCIQKIGKLDNVVCKISGLNINLNKEKETCYYIVRECIKNFSSKNIVVGSNYPVYLTEIDATSWFKTIVEILEVSNAEVSKEVREDILFNNPYRIYFKKQDQKCSS